MNPCVYLHAVCPHCVDAGKVIVPEVVEDDRNIHVDNL
jgi:hypothetical protein